MRKGLLPGFDLLKYLMAVLIMTIHTESSFSEFPILTMFLQPLRNVSVPLFFILSSYFFFRKIETNGPSWSILKTTLIRLMKLYLFWFVICLPITINEKCYFDDFHGIIYLIKDLLFNSTYSGSWFLSALMISLSIIWAAIKLKVRSCIIILLGLLSYIIIRVYWSYPDNIMINILQKLVHEELDFSFIRGMIWCSLGYMFSKRNISILLDKIKYKKISFLILFTFQLLFINNVFLYEFCRFLEILLIFCLFKSLSLNKKFNNSLYRNKSVLYFFLHFRVIFVCAFIGLPRENFVFFIIVFLTTDFLSVLMLRMQNLKYFKWLRYAH